MLYGRDSERAVIDTLLADARAGRSGALLLCGDAGIGKTALLDHAAEVAADMPVLRSVGIESETRVPFAALHMLLRHSLAAIGNLPEPQADALRGALGLGEPSPGDRFLLGVAVLSLLTEIAGDGPLLCLIDDAGWIDRASADALLFAARRFDAEGIVLILATRDTAGFALPQLRLDPLDSTAAEALLGDHAGALAPAVRDRILADASGNPLALLELPAALTPEQRAGGPADELPLPGRIEDLYRAMIDALAEPARDLLLIAAADNTGDLGLVLRAAGSDVDDLATLEKAQLIRLTPTTIAFRHPLIRAATYVGAPLTARWTAHRALAEALGDSDPERRAHHLIALATGPDEPAAAELERSAVRARERGALAAAADAYRGAARLSTGTTAARRLTLAAEAAEELGNHARATQLAEEAEPHTTDPELRARLATVRGHASYARGHVQAAYRYLHTAATLVPQRSLRLLAEMVRLARATGNPEIAGQTAELLDRLRLPADDPIHQLLRWTIYRQLGRDPADLPLLADTVAAALRVDGVGPRGRLFLADAGLIAGDTAQIHGTVDELVNTIRDTGTVGLLADALAHQADLRVMRGRYRDARLSAAEAMELARATGQPEWVVHAGSVLALVAAIEGAEDDCIRYAEMALGAGTDRTTSSGTSGPHLALALLDLGLGRAERALERLDSLVHGATRFQLRVLRSTPDLVEAAVRSGQPARAAESFARYEQWAGYARQPWIDALVLRCRALLAPDDEAEQNFLAALDIREPDHPLEPARTALLYGEWLRRNRRRNDARTYLRTALDTFERLGAQTWADRAHTELRAAGESIAAAERVPDVLDSLTPQESQVVRLAAAGLSNRAIGAQLFLSPRTVGYHLYKAYPKLGVASRTELAHLSWH